MAQRFDNTDKATKGGRPPAREVSAQTLLSLYVEYDRELGRQGRRLAASRAGFAKKLDKTAPTVRYCFRDYNFPFPPVGAGQLVLLLDDAEPNELLWISDAWCELTGRNHDDLMFQSVTYLRSIGLADGPREVHQAVARQLRAADPKALAVAMAEGWIVDATGRHCPAAFEMRYGSRSKTFYVRATLLEEEDDEVAGRRRLIQGDVIDLNALVADWDSPDIERATVARQQALETLLRISVPRIFGKPRAG